MAIGITESPPTSIAKLLQDNVFAVPPHQRDYSWGEDEVRQLFDDIENAMEQEDNLYFLGLTVFMKSETDQLIVLDGQQRLATVYIFMASVRNWLNQYSDLTTEGNKVQNTFLGQSEFGETNVKPRLVLNSANNPIFESYIVKSRPIKDLRSALSKMKKSDRGRKLLEAAIFCHDRILSISDEHSDYKDAAKRLFDIMVFLRDKTPVVNVTVPSESAAFTIFETLNDRGLVLSPLDLVKNHLFHCVGMHSPTRLRDLEQRWGQMMYNLENVNPDQFLKAFWTSRHGRVQASVLYDELKKKYNDNDTCFDVSIDLLAASEHYAAIFSADDPIWSKYSDRIIRDHVRNLRILGANQVHPIILAAIMRIEGHEMERLLRLLEVLTVRYQLIGGGRTGALEIACASVAQKIWGRTISTATEAMTELRTVYPSDQEFQSAFTDKPAPSGAKTQYLLRKLEAEERRQKMGKMAPETDVGQNLTVEHVYPSNPEVGWEALELEDVDGDLSSLLGNVCLLSRVNANLGNAQFETKRKTYAASDLLLTKQIAERGQWDYQTIVHRQAHMAKLAVQAWRFQ
ncbi:MAG: DUF262 domain-containing protein [Proteobacteria bacterium]|nr:DUF262 domain-containing protein [Pseudomonadota bacterium]